MKAKQANKIISVIRFYGEDYACFMLINWKKLINQQSPCEFKNFHSAVNKQINFPLFQ